MRARRWQLAARCRGAPGANGLRWKSLGFGRAASGSNREFGKRVKDFDPQQHPSCGLGRSGLALAAQLCPQGRSSQRLSHVEPEGPRALTHRLDSQACCPSCRERGGRTERVSWKETLLVQKRLDCPEPWPVARASPCTSGPAWGHHSHLGGVSPSSRS